MAFPSPGVPPIRSGKIGVAALVYGIGRKASRRTAELAGELVHNKSENKESVLAELEFQQWLVEASHQCLD